MLRPDRFQLDSDLNERRRGPSDKLTRFWDFRRSCRRSNRNVDNPVIVPNLLVMSQLSDDFARCCSLSQKRTSCKQVSDDHQRLRVAVF